MMMMIGNRWNKEKLVPYRELIERIEKRFGGLHKLSDDPNDTTKVKNKKGCCHDNQLTL